MAMTVTLWPRESPESAAVWPKLRLKRISLSRASVSTRLASSSKLRSVASSNNVTCAQLASFRKMESLVLELGSFSLV